MFWLFLLFTAVPLVELWLLVWIGSQTSVLTAISVVILTGIVGAALARWQGLRAIQRVQDQLRQGIMPAEAMTDGLMIFVAGLLLVTPGILTDAVGLALLLPPVRILLRRLLQRWMKAHFEVVSTGPWQTENHPGPAGGRDTIVDAHVVKTEVVDE